MSKTLLFVDDEKQILKAVRRLFLDTDYSIYTAESGEEALQVLNDAGADLIVVDMRMPVMNGYELLTRVKQKHPSTIRLILSGYADEKLIIGALQNNLAKIYLFKPWENKRLIRIIEQALSVEEILSSERVVKSIEFIKRNLLEDKSVIEELSQFEQSTDMHGLLQRIYEDKTLQGRIFSILNSSFMDIHIDSMDEALNILGKFIIESIAIAEMLFECKSKITTDERLQKDLEYATLSNRITDLIYKQLLNQDLGEMNAVAGLMHSIGKYANLDIQLKAGNSSKNIEADYMELSGYILNRYGFMYPVIETALFHHSPMDSRVFNRKIVAVVHLAGYYSAALLGEKQDWSLDKSVFKYLGFTQKDCDRVIAEIIPRIDVQ